MRLFCCALCDGINLYWCSCFLCKQTESCDFKKKTAYTARQDISQSQLWCLVWWLLSIFKANSAQTRWFTWVRIVRENFHFIDTNNKNKYSSFNVHVVSCCIFLSSLRTFTFNIRGVIRCEICGCLGIIFILATCWQKKNSQKSLRYT